ncbi:unnamed protein product [Prorocentrum cordatum]|uniref:Uncharacterized protein n=1 Tax=Prorocentrum cordatum TaxID=2364126 RepID=A0ABN9Q6E8_9DINO|nr:unnamed protein product [Polarella glacialis]
MGDVPDLSMGMHVALSWSVANGILGPSVDVHRVARNGRNFEYLSGEETPTSGRGWRRNTWQECSRRASLQSSRAGGGSSTPRRTTARSARRS